MRELVVVLPRPHAGQQRIIDQARRFNCVRCARRYGKTTTIEIIASRRLLAGKRVGFFAPTFQYFEENWRRFERRLRPVIRRINKQEKTIELLTGGILEGWSLDKNKDPGRGRNYHDIIVEEAGLVPDLEELFFVALRPTLIDYAPDSYAWFIGTPKLANEGFNDLCDLAQDATRDWAYFEATTFDNPHLPASELEEIRALLTEGKMSPREWEQEYLAKPGQAANAFFDRSVIDGLMQEAVPPLHTGHIRVPLGDALGLSRPDFSKVEWTEDPNGPWKLWCPLENGRPPQNTTYAGGWDVSFGVGASNTTGSFTNAETGVQVATYANSGVTPEEAARIAAGAGHWFGGVHKAALLNPEISGAGEAFVGALRNIRYPLIFRATATPSAPMTSPTGDLGWRSTLEGKKRLLSEYRSSLYTRTHQVRDAETLRECKGWKLDKRDCPYSTNEMAVRASAPGEGMTPHGDRVIADALSVLACTQVRAMPVPEIKVRVGSAQWQIEQRKQRERQGSRPW